MDLNSGQVKMAHSEVLLISEQVRLPPSWEPLHYHFNDLRFPFFNTEPLLLVIEGHPSHYQKALTLFQELSELQLQTQTILVDIQLSSEQLIELTNHHKPFRIINYQEKEQLEELLTDAFNTARKLKQDKVLVELFNEQNTELKKLSVELEEKIKRRQKRLEQAKDKLSETNKKSLFLQECLIAIHNSLSISELESRVTEILQDRIDLLWFKIVFDHDQPLALWNKQEQINTYQVPLSKNQQDYGQLLFAKPQTLHFKRSEKNLLDQIGEAIALCLERILQIEKNNELRSQWQATFNAISDPVSLIDKEYNIHIANQNFLSASNLEKVEGKKCYQVLFNRNSPCVECKRGEQFRLKNHKNPTQVYDVFSQQMVIDNQTHYFHLYRDISKQLGFERQILESAKLAELGTIGSSIAHELNNPLGGMLNFLQLIRMDLTGNEDYYNEILEMEKGAVKCKEIVQNLLGFSRHANLSELRSIDLIEIINQSILITELRTRALGIKIDLSIPDKKILVEGRFNQLAQALCNILQNAYESILVRKGSHENFQGNIKINILLKENHVDLTITDNGIGISKEIREQIFDPLFTTKDPNKNPGLGLTLAQQILLEHHAKLNLTPQKDDETCFIIRFPKLKVS